MVNDYRFFGRYILSTAFTALLLYIINTSQLLTGKLISQFVSIFTYILLR